MRLKYKLSLGIDSSTVLSDSFSGQRSASAKQNKSEHCTLHAERRTPNTEPVQPLVSVLMGTFNRPGYMAEALGSIVRQNYRNLQIIVVNDGGCDVSGIVESFNDPRIIFINRKENRGFPFSLNEALGKAKGKYICYLGDDDLFYPNHVEELVNALENHSEYQAAYSDLYKVFCKVNPDGSRTALSKVIEISRDYDPFLMLYFNNVLHVSLMHRRDLLEKTGLYNEKLNVLIDWDMTRRLAFFTDFLHIHRITGEYYLPAGDCDRISVKRRKNKQEYARNVLTIRTTRPPKPWSKFADLSIIYLPEKFNRDTGTTIGLIWKYTFYPYKLYLPLPDEDSDRFKTEMPNIVTVPLAACDTQLRKIEKTFSLCEGQYIAVVPDNFPIRDLWVEDSLHGLIYSKNNHEAFELEDSTQNCIAIVARREHIELALQNIAGRQGKQTIQHLYDGLIACGVKIRRVTSEEIPFRFDMLLKKARIEQKNGNFKNAANLYIHLANNYQNQVLMKSMAAEALFQAGDFRGAAEITSSVNRQRPTVDTLLLEAKLNRLNQNFEAALTLLNKACEILLNKGQLNEQGKFIPTQSR